MPRTALELKSGTALESSPSPLAATDLPYWIDQWRLDGECRLHSSRTLETKRLFLTKLHWFLQTRHLSVCGTLELRQFFAYLGSGHTEPGGRWGNPRQTKPLRPITVKDYHGCLRSFFNWLIENEAIAIHPMAAIKPPIARTDHKPPLAPEQVQALLGAARKGLHARRDEAVLLFLLDTGIRSTELISLKLRDIDLTGRRCTVLGKGNKRRAVFFGPQTTRVLSVYLRGTKRGLDDPLFLSERSRTLRQPLTRSGLQQLIRKHARSAGIHDRVSPHALRRTFAVEILKNGAHVFGVREMLGHENLQMTQKYLRIAQADVEAQHRQNSPVESLYKVSR